MDGRMHSKLLSTYDSRSWLDVADNLSSVSVPANFLCVCEKHQWSDSESDSFHQPMGTPLNIFKILKNLTEKKIRGFQDLEAKKFKKFQTY